MISAPLGIVVVTDAAAATVQELQGCSTLFEVGLDPFGQNCTAGAADPAVGNSVSRMVWKLLLLTRLLAPHAGVGL